MNNRFVVLKEEWPPDQRRPYRIIEKLRTADGPRDRIVDGRWETLESAIAIVNNILFAEKERP